MAIELMASEEYVDGKVAAEAQARTLLAATVQTNTSSLVSLSSRVGDNETAIANRYTKTEVDAKVAGVQTFQKLVVNELPSAEAADDKTIYLVPRTGSETPDLCDEYVVVGAAGSRRWEKIGGGTVDLANYYTKAETNAALAGKASTADVTLTPVYSQTPTFSEWVVEASDGESDITVVPSPPGGEFVVWLGTGDIGEFTFDEPNSRDFYATELHGTLNGIVFTATRTRTDLIGYTLGSQSDKPLQPKGDYALLSEVYAAVQQIAPAFEVRTSQDPYSQGELVSKDGVIYQCDDALFYGEWSALSWTAKKVSELLTLLAPLASPAFTGTPTAPTPASGDNSTKVATTAFVQAAISGISVTPLSGQTFNFATTQGVMDALKTVIETLGGTVSNAPITTISQGE